MEPTTGDPGSFLISLTSLGPLAFALVTVVGLVIALIKGWLIVGNRHKEQLDTIEKELDRTVTRYEAEIGRIGAERDASRKLAETMAATNAVTVQQLDEALEANRAVVHFFDRFPDDELGGENVGKQQRADARRSTRTSPREIESSGS